MVARALMQNSALRAISMESNAIGFDGALAMAEMLAFNRHVLSQCLPGTLLCSACAVVESLDSGKGGRRPAEFPPEKAQARVRPAERPNGLSASWPCLTELANPPGAVPGVRTGFSLRCC